MTAGVTARPALRAVPVTSPRLPGGQLGVAIIDDMPLFREGLSVRVLRDPGMRLAGVAGTVDPRLTVVVLVREPCRTSHYLAAVRASGAHGLVPHSAPPERIMAAIRRSRTDGQHIDPALADLVTDSLTASMSVAGRPLSRREDEVLRLIADGYSNQGIANALVVSVETVRTHIKSLLRKLSARDRAHAVSLGYRAGLLVVDSAEPAIPQARSGLFGSPVAMS